MVNKKDTLQYTIKWIMPDKGKVAFKEVETTFTLSEKVIKADPTRWGVKPGIKVDVHIIGTEVTYLRKSENQDVIKEEVKETPVSETKQPEVKFEDEKPTSEVKVLTIAGITATKEVISFKEDTGTKWYQVPEEFRKQFDTLGIKARATVSVTFGEIEIKGVLKPSIETIAVVKNEVKLESKDSPEIDSSPTGSSDKAYIQYKVKNSTGTSIENQVALKGAVEVVVALINQNKLNEVNAKDKVSELTAQFIKDIAN